jgi:hypothetical protein
LLRYAPENTSSLRGKRLLKNKKLTASLNNKTWNNLQSKNDKIEQ